MLAADGRDIVAIAARPHFTRVSAAEANVEAVEKGPFAPITHGRNAGHDRARRG